ncbi:sensor histidine kinase [Sphingomonas koreensis]|nr:sensor histidine kinase [Sphingomonas koreensis]
MEGAPLRRETASGLAIALVLSSNAPLVLLDEHLVVRTASRSFCGTFALDSASVVDVSIFALGDGEWDIPQLRSLLDATLSGTAAIDAYEIDLVRQDHPPCRLVLNAHKLDYAGSTEPLIVLAITDVTAARLAEKLKQEMIGQQQIMFQELQHRVANSLQIIASVLMQSARKVQSEETRVHLRDAHHRVMSIATLQRHLAATNAGDVVLRQYFTDLCSSIAASMISDPQRVSLTATIDDSVASADVSVSLGLIVTELVINALKHAFPGRAPTGKISVEYYHCDSNKWALIVGDDGVGMPGDHEVAKRGLGSGIIEALSRQLGATVNVTGAHPGTRVSILHS